MLVFASKSLTPQRRVSWHVISDLLKQWLALCHKCCLLALSISFTFHKSLDYLFMERKLELGDKQGEWGYTRILFVYWDDVRRTVWWLTHLARNRVFLTQELCVLLLYKLHCFGSWFVGRDRLSWKIKLDFIGHKGQISGFILKLNCGSCAVWVINWFFLLWGRLDSVVRGMSLSRRQLSMKCWMELMIYLRQLFWWF